MNAERVVVVGAGPAGTRAAETLVRAGLRPIVIDEAPQSGGQIYRRPPTGFTRPASALYGFEAAKAAGIHGIFDALQDRVDYRPGTTVWNIHGGALHTIANDGRRDVVAYSGLVLATGAMDRVIPFPGWTLPGVYTLGGAQIALKYQGCSIGRRVAFLGSSPLLYLVAYQYAKAGAEIAAVLDTAPLGAKLAALPQMAWGGATAAKGLYYVAWLKARGIRVVMDAEPVRAEGTDGVEALVWHGPDGSEQRLECDALAFGYGLKSETQLADLAEIPFGFNDAQRQFLPLGDADGRTAAKGVYLCGDGAGIAGADAAELSGERAALALLDDRGVSVDKARVATVARKQTRLARFRAGMEQAFPFPADLSRRIADATVVCRCESITAGELRGWMKELDALEVNRAKAFSRVGMGRCQGRVCGTAAAEVIATESGLHLRDVGRLRAQPPIKPLPLAQ